MDKPTCPGPFFDWQLLEDAGVALAKGALPAAAPRGKEVRFAEFELLKRVASIGAGTRSDECRIVKQLLHDIGYSVVHHWSSPSLTREEQRAEIDDRYDGVAIAAVMAFQRRWFSGRRRKYKLAGTGSLDKKKPAEGTLDQQTITTIMEVWFAAMP